jgi:predicted nucleic acid binding AN1-type Zn finger protein
MASLCPEVVNMVDGVVKKTAAKRRCAHCKKRLGMMYFTCRCGKDMCQAHLAPEEHACTFDFKGAGRDQIRSSNPVVSFEKVTPV